MKTEHTTENGTVIRIGDKLHSGIFNDDVSYVKVLLFVSGGFIGKSSWTYDDEIDDTAFYSFETSHIHMSDYNWKQWIDYNKTNKTRLNECLSVFDNLSNTERVIVMDGYNKITGVKN